MDSIWYDIKNFKPQNITVSGFVDFLKILGTIFKKLLILLLLHLNNFSSEPSNFRGAVQNFKFSF